MLNCQIPFSIESMTVTTRQVDGAPDVEDAKVVHDIIS